MKYSAILFDNPRIVSLLLLLIIVAGVGSFTTNARQEDPDLTQRFAFVNIVWQGASSERIENLITNIVETGLDIEEIKEITSTSLQGRSTFTIELHGWVDQRNAETVWSLVRDKLDQISNQLPQTVAEPTVFINIISAQGLVIAFKNRANLQDTTILTRYADYFARKISSIPGTRTIDVIGAPEQHILVAPDIGAMNRLNLSINSLTGLISNHDVRRPTGTVANSWGEIKLEIADSMTSVTSIANLPVTDNIRIADIASVKKSKISPAKKLALHQGEETVLVAIRPFYNQRMDVWVENTLQSIHKLEKDLPEAIEMEVVFNQAIYTDQRFSGLSNSLMMAVAIVFVLLCITLGIRTSLVISLTVPLIMLGSLALMGIVNLTFHQLSITGLIISLGMMIDNPIVISDHFAHLRSTGKSLREAVLLTTKDLQGPLLASTLTTCFAFLPIAAGSGASSEFVGGLALAVVLSVTVSYIVAIGFLPILLSWLDSLKLSFKLFNSGIQLTSMHAGYKKFLKMCIKKPAIGIGIGLVLPILGFATIPYAEQHFFPPVDRDMFQIAVSFPKHFNIAQGQTEIIKIDEYLRELTYIKEATWTIGDQSPRVFYNMIQPPVASSNQATGFITTISAQATRSRLPDLQLDLIKQFPGIFIRVQPFNQGPPSDAPIQVKLIGEDIDDLKFASQEIRKLLIQIPEVTFTEGSLVTTELVDSYSLFQHRLQAANVSGSSIPSNVYSAYGETLAGTIDDNGKSLQITIQVPEQLRSNRQAVETLPLLFRQNGQISMSDVAEAQVTARPAGISHLDSQRISIVNAFVVPYSLAISAEQKFRKILEEADLTLPSGVTLDYGGESSNSSESLASFLSTAGIFFVLIILTVVLLIGSYSLAAVIFGVMILSFGLAMLGLFFSGEPTGFISIVGSLGLIGLAVNDSIIVTSAIKRATAAGDFSFSNITSAIFRATRHIISTTLTTMGGFLPLILSGEKLWLGLSWAIVGGISGASVLSLTLVPAMFAILNKKQIVASEINAEKP